MSTQAFKVRLHLALLVVAAAVCLGNVAAMAQTGALGLNPDHPDRYTVKPGDTLWGIADKYLQDPWRWPELWQRNPNIENPHLIFPGDVLVLSTVDGKPQLRALQQRKLTKLSPAIYVRKREDAIPTIQPSAIQPYLTSPLIVAEDELGRTGYVAAGDEGKIALGKYSVFFARGMANTTEKDGGYFQIFRPLQRLIHPETEEDLGLETLHVGDARMLDQGETARLEVISSNGEVVPGDRLLAVDRDIELPYFEPRSPDQQLSGLIITAPGRVNELGKLDTVIISLGTREQIEPGHVLRVLRQEPAVKDPSTGKLFLPPPQDSGLVMVFRVFEKVSYALVVSSNSAIQVHDKVETP